MIRISTTSDGYSVKNAVLDNESFFTQVVLDEFGELQKYVDDVIWEIDKAKIVDTDKDIVVTPFGPCLSWKLSTGCKTVLNYMWVKAHKTDYNYIKAVYATEAGANALEILFRIMDELNDSDTEIILEHKNKLFNCSKRDYLINDTRKIRNLILL